MLEQEEARARRIGRRLPKELQSSLRGLAEVLSVKTPGNEVIMSEGVEDNQKGIQGEGTEEENMLNELLGLAGEQDPTNSSE